MLVVNCFVGMAFMCFCSDSLWFQVKYSEMLPFLGSINTPSLEKHHRYVTGQGYPCLYRISEAGFHLTV